MTLMILYPCIYYLTGFLDFCDIPDLMAHLQENYRYWKEKSEDEAS